MRAAINIGVGVGLLYLTGFHLIGWLILGFCTLLVTIGELPPPHEFIVTEKKCPFCGSLYFGRQWRHCVWEEDGTRYNRPIVRYCPNCQRVTVDKPWIPDNDNLPVSVKPNQANWVRCPCCHKHFSLESDSWTGERHITCGQRLVIDVQE